MPFRSTIEAHNEPRPGIQSSPTLSRASGKDNLTSAPHLYVHFAIDAIGPQAIGHVDEAGQVRERQGYCGGRIGGRKSVCAS